MALSLLLFAEDDDFARGKDPDDAGGLCGGVGVVGAVGEAAVDAFAEERRDVGIGGRRRLPGKVGGGADDRVP